MPDQPRTSPPFVKMCRRTRGSPFLAVHKDVQRRFQLGEFCVGTLAYTLARSDWPRSTKLMTIDNAVCSLTALQRIWKRTQIWEEKSSLATRRNFGLNSYINKHNSHIWDDANPHEIHLVLMHPQNVTIWRGFLTGGIVGLYFFENHIGEAITVNSGCYRTLL